MRLDLLLERESFSEIFVETMSRYLRNRFHWEGEIWLVDGFHADQNSLLAHSKLNLIYPRSYPTKDLRILSAEYAFNPRLIKRVMQYLYVRYSVVRPLRLLTSSFAVNFEPWPDAISEWCILPGNHSIRIVDICNNQCIVLCKSGFRRERMAAETSLRQRFPRLPIPELLEFNPAEGWYREQRIVGLPINRVSDAKIAGNALLAARKALIFLYNSTNEYISLNDWVHSKISSIIDAVDSLPNVYFESHRTSILAKAERLGQLLLRDSTANCTLPLTITHGDFQPGNILVPEQSNDCSVYLIDWEHAALRCRWYDSLVFEFDCRSPVGLAQRMSIWSSDKNRISASLNWCCDNLIEDISLDKILAIFLLEELLFRTHDSLIPQAKIVNLGFIQFMEELDEVLRVLS